eukprot:CAMPEP_0184691510 /NCGR_PEP_ID=MMETSP0313-20130426/347_1 /TAXON_ID=2792 /ORGANISM="Porphyridium aerugineum, Strain SAG 1380-2" /LENGTH=204 /DNA_ID=CAMNT_0027149243 /DNA_START=133 /DNA_END=744 /DNA_ORIENTATION=-
MQRSGLLEVMVVEGRRLTDKDILGKQDPYVILRLSHGEFKRTRTVNNGGKNPRFMQKLSFNVNQVASQNLRLYVEVYDDDVGKDDLIGRAEIPLNSLMTGTVTGSEQSYSLTSKSGKFAGDIVLSISFYPDNRPGVAPNAPGYPLTNAPTQPYGSTYQPPNTAYPPGPAPGYGAPPAQPAYGGYGAPPPAQYGAPQQGYGAPPP